MKKKEASRQAPATALAFRGTPNQLTINEVQ